MGSGMNTERAKEYAKTMTYSQAVSNIKHGKGIKYRKATMIKLRELAEIADRLARKTEDCSEKPNNCESCKDDLIRRSDAIESFCNKECSWGISHNFNCDCELKNIIKAIPAIEPSKDAISREYALGVIYPSNIYPSRADIYKALRDAPSVTAETDIDDYMKGYDHGTADTWKIAQTVFGSTVTLYEAMDVAKCMKGSDDEHDK